MKSNVTSKFCFFAHNLQYIRSMKEKTSESQSVVEESQVYASAVVETENKSPVATTPSTAAAAAEISLG
jgi:hypothetical protein